MPKVSKELTQELNLLPNKDLVKIIVKYARRHADMNEELHFQYTNSESTIDLYDELIDTIHLEMTISNRGIIQKNLAKAIGVCNKEINNFAKVTKSKYHEALALQILLIFVLDNYESDLGTCWTSFDSKVAAVSKKYFNTVLALHEDYYIEFQDKFQKILDKVNRHCSHYDSIYELPETFEEMVNLKHKLRTK